MESAPLKATQLNPPLNVTHIRDLAGLEKLKDFFTRCQVLGWDIETTPLKDFFWRRIRTIQFGNQQEQYVIDLRAFCGNDSDLLYNCQGFYGLNLPPSLLPVIDAIRPVLCSKDWLKVGVNLGFEYENFYWCLGMRPWHFFDCALAERCIWAGAHSLKDYSYYSMEEMMERYFGVQIEKELQESFTLDCELTAEQIAYAALDTRFPIALRQVQLLILQGETVASLRAKGSSAARLVQRIDPLVTGDKLLEIAQIENDAIGAFQDMHVHGENIDRPRWLERIAKRKLERNQVIHDELDPVFIPIVGSKYESNTDEEIAAAEAKWKWYNIIPDAELQLKKLTHQHRKSDPDQAAIYEQQRQELEVARKAEKEHYKTICSEMKKKRTAIKNLAAKCEGEALINYNSDTQLLNILNGMKGLKGLHDMQDDSLEEFEHIPVISALRKFSTLSKEIGTYGEQWATEWVTKAGKKEGWLHPGDGKLHCTFNQLDAETGRSTSEKPNGQNIPNEPDVRGCFIADPPNEAIRISTCCEADTEEKMGGTLCTKCRVLCQTKPEEYVILTADMSGAELRIIAELADDPVWIAAFARGEDVHAVGTELLYPDEWPKLALPDCAYFKKHTEETVAANLLRMLGDLQRQKCKCPEHKDLRDDNKATNFLLAYGGGPTTLAARIKKAVAKARELMGKHKAKNPYIWAYLDRAGNMAKMLKKSFDIFGRRRLFPDPTWERAKEKVKADREEELRLPDDEAARNKANFIQFHGRKPTKPELWLLTHREPSSKEIASAFKAMHGSIERQGKNHGIQGSNATIAKKAMGCGFCPAGKPYLWHTLPEYKAKLIKFVHDELVIQVPKRFAKAVADLVGDAFKRAAAEKMKKVVMEFDYNIATYWKK